MSAGTLTIWAVDLARVRAVIGSRQQDWLARLERSDDPQPLRDAARSLVMRGGPPFLGDPRSLAIVLGDIVTAIGVRLPDNAGADLDFSLLESADAVLAREGVGIQASSLVFAGAPLPGFPEAESLPMLGHLSAEEVRRAGAVLATKILRAPDARVDHLLGELSDWVEVASARGESLVGIFA